MQCNRFITRCPQWLKIDVILGHTWKGPDPHDCPSFLFFQTCCPATWCWRLLTQRKGSKVELEPGKVWGRNVVENSIAWYCMHVLSFFVARASSWNVGEHTYLSPFSIPLFLLLPPSSSASCRQMILTQLALTKLLMSTLRVCRHERVADWTGPKGTLCIQFCD